MERYIAFISYRHREKTQQVSGLIRKKMESYHLPRGVSLPKKRRVFRDTDELPTSADLGADIENALKGSGWLICLCTEDYPASRWCMREVEEFLALERKDHILPVLVSGDPEVSVPELIRDIPPAADLRGAEGRELKKRTDRAVAALLGRIGGCTEEEAAASERRYRTGIAAATAASITAVLLGFSLYASNTADRITRNNEEIRIATRKAEEAREEAIAERDNALLKNAKYYSRLAWNAISQEDPDEAIRQVLPLLEDLQEGEPVSGDAVGALRMALSMPSRPKESYRFQKRVDTDFTITGYRIDPNNDDRIFLSTGEEGLPGKYMLYDDGTLGEMTFSICEEALEKGYSFGYMAFTGSPNHSIFYGPEKQMMITGSSATEGYERLITLNGEPYYADHIIDSKTGFTLAWMSDPASGPSPNAAIIDKTRSEAAAVPELKNNPACASFSGNLRRLTVIDEDGRLLHFDGYTGELKGTVPGKWSWACYPAGEAARFCATDPDGNAWLYDAGTLEPIFRFESPSPIRSVLYCMQKEYFLACCDDGVRIYNGADGALRFEILTGEKPLFAVWSRMDESGIFNLGNSFVTGYPNHADIYVLDTETDTARSDYIPLYRQGTAEVTSSRDAAYSPDSRYIYISHGTRALTKWNASNGEFIWSCTEEGRADSAVPCTIWLSRDGKTIWRSDYKGKGVQQVFADTGETGYTVETGRIEELLESPDGTKILAIPEYSGGITVFDAADGTILWQADLACECMFSEDGREVICIYEEKQEDGTRLIRRLRLDSATGKAGSGQTLVKLDPEQYPEGKTYPDGDVDYELDISSGQLDVIYKSAKTDDSNRIYTIWLFRVSEDEPFAVTEITKDFVSVWYSYTGQAFVHWSSPEGSYAQAVLPDGTLGDPAEQNSPEGRILFATAYSYAVFGNDEVSKSGHRLTRISDGALILDAENHNGITVAPDGGSLCLTSTYSTPCIILASDTDELVRKAKLRMGGD